MDGGHYQCVLSLPAVYSWDEIGETEQNYNTFTHTDTHRHTQTHSSDLVIVNAWKDTGSSYFRHAAGPVVEAVWESGK